jgi:membrane protease YdiL (CAAX protease family)
MSVNLVAKLRRLFGGIITLIGESSWVLFCFFVVAAVVFGLLLNYVPVLEDFFDTTLGQLLAGGLIYALVVLVVVLPIWLLRGHTYVRTVLGLVKKPTISILWLPLLMWAAYMGATIIVAIGASFLPWVDPEQKQNVGFEGLTQPVEYVIAFLALVVLPPIAEELLFRGYLFGRLRERFGFWLTTVVVSAVFGFVHMQWNVGIDVAVLSVFLCYLRERTGSLWASMVLHGIKNGLAYFLLFIAPLLGWQLVQ